MAKKSSIVKNEKRKALCVKFAAVRAELKAKLLDTTISNEEYFAAQRKMAKLPRNSSPVRVRNRCSLTGRPRGFHSWFGVSRLKLREMASYGELPGVTKSSW